MRPMLATAADRLPVGAGWGYEFKWDGIRVLADITDARLRLETRQGNDCTVAYPELVDLAGGVEDALIDGEVVAFDNGRPSFAKLQTRMHVRAAGQAVRLVAEAPVTLIAFDLLRLYGVDLTARPLSERRATLERLALDHEHLTVSPLFEDGPATEQAARAHGLEGVVAKRLASPYRPGTRTTEWIKVKFTNRTDFVVVGWGANRERPGVLSSLLLAYNRDGRLVFAGNAGSGLTGRTCSELQERLVPRATAPLAEVPPMERGKIVTWVEPEVVVDVTYGEFTRDGRLRFPVINGVRTDVDPSEVGEP